MQHPLVSKAFEALARRIGSLFDRGTAEGKDSSYVAESSVPPLHIKVSSLCQLMPGQDLGMDVVCNGVLEGAEFTFPAEEVVIKGQNALGSRA